MLTDIAADTDAEIANTAQAVSPTAHLLDELQLFGWRPNGDEPDPRPLPDAARAEGAVADMVESEGLCLAGDALTPEGVAARFGEIGALETATPIPTAFEQTFKYVRKATAGRR